MLRFSFEEPPSSVCWSWYMPTWATTGEMYKLKCYCLSLRNSCSPKRTNKKKKENEVYSYLWIIIAKAINIFHYLCALVTSWTALSYVVTLKRSKAHRKWDIWCAETEKEGENSSRQQYPPTSSLPRVRMWVGNGGVQAECRTSLFCRCVWKDAVLSLVESLIGGLLWVTSVGVCSLC